jgi:O-antigen/teichoic acid export membrane protein
MYGDRWTLQFLFGARELGIYSALYQVANAPITLVGGFVSQLTVPVVFERAGALTSEHQLHRSKAFLYKAVSLFAVVMACGAVMAALLSRPVVRLLTSSVIAEHHSLLWIIFLGIAVFQIAQQTAVVGQIHKRTSVYIPAFAVNAAATVLLSLLLGRRYGIGGVAVALLISNSLHLAAILMINRIIAKSETSKLKFVASAT